MALIQHLLIIVITITACGMAGASKPATFCITLVVVIIGVAIRDAWFSDPWTPIEQLKGQLPSDHKLLAEARQQATDSLSQFWSLCAKGIPLDAKVRVHLTNPSGKSEDVWMFLLSLPDEDARIHVHLSERPQLPHEFDLTGDIDFFVHTNQIVDWSIEQSDGTIRGTFTTFALFEIYEKSIGALPDRTKAPRDCFVDAR